MKWTVHGVEMYVAKANDSTLSVSGADPETLNKQIKEKYDALSSYMLRNCLVLNSEKTQAQKNRRL